MGYVRTFTTISQTFAAALTVMAQRMTRTETILAQIQEHLDLPPIPLTTPAAAAPTSPTLPPVALAASSAALAASSVDLTVPSAVHSPAVPPEASSTLPTDHPAVPTPSQDEDEVPPPTAT